MKEIIHFIMAHSLLFLALFAVLATLIKVEWDEGATTGDIGRETVSPQQAVILINHEQAVVVDMRAQEEYAQGHVLGAVSVPLSKLDGQLAALKKCSSKPLIIYGVNQKAFDAVKIKLATKNVQNVFNLKGGLEAWRVASMPVEKG